MTASPLRIATEGKRLPRRINFSARTLAAVRCPPGADRIQVYDAKTPHLAWRVTSNGVGAFYFYKKVAGAVKRVRIGGSELSVEQARKQAAKLSGGVADGVDPSEQKRIARAATATLGDLLDNFIERHAKLHKKSWQGDEDQIERYLSDWKSRRLASIKSDDIRALHAAVGKKHGPYSANRLLAMIHSAYRKAGNLWAGPNPAAGISRFREKSRDRFLQAGELPRFFAALADEPNETIKDFITTALLTGQRRSNVMAMAWSEIDFERATWRIPETKNGQPLVVPLSPPAADLLKRRKENAKGEYVFPGHGKSGHLVEAKAAWRAILKRAKITDLRLHDLRRSLGSWMAISGSSLLVVGKALGHKSTAATQVYSRLSLDPVRAGVDLATAAMMTAGQGQPQKDGAK